MCKKKAYVLHNNVNYKMQNKSITSKNCNWRLITNYAKTQWQCNNKLKSQWRYINVNFVWQVRHILLHYSNPLYDFKSTWNLKGDSNSRPHSMQTGKTLEYLQSLHTNATAKTLECLIVWTVNRQLCMILHNTYKCTGSIKYANNCNIRNNLFKKGIFRI